jgi:hypothetical protein
VRNEELRARRRDDPDLLAPGDPVFLPDPEPKSIEAPAGAVLRIVVHLPRERLSLRLTEDEGRPLRDHRYRLVHGLTVHEGDADSPIELDGPFEEKTLALTLLDGSGAVVEELTLLLAGLPPCCDERDGLAGIQARLSNLGFAPGPVDGVPGPQTLAAIRSFQALQGLPVTGLPDDVREPLRKEHGS